jgi:hypothetical protein
MPNKLGDGPDPNKHNAALTPDLGPLLNLKTILADDLPRLAALQAEFVRLQGLLGQHSYEEINRQRDAARVALREDTSKLTTEALAQLDDDHERKHAAAAAARSLIKDSMRAFTLSQVIPAVLPVAKRALADAERILSELERDERALAEKFATEWQPSPLHQSVRGRIAHWQQHLANVEAGKVHNYAPPSSFLDGLISCASADALKEAAGREAKPPKK